MHIATAAAGAFSHDDTPQRVFAPRDALLVDRAESAAVGRGCKPQALPGVPLLVLPQKRQATEGRHPGEGSEAIHQVCVRFDKKNHSFDRKFGHHLINLLPWMLL